MDARTVLERHGIRPSKGLGQNFLVDRRVQRRIVEVAELSGEDIVLEVGPGLGLLTRELAAAVGQVVAIELDRRMIDVLADTLAGLDNIHILQGDILEIDPPRAIAQALNASDPHVRYQVVANLPYYITSAVLRHLLTAEPRPQRLTVMVQHEVAQRIVATPGDLSLLALGVQVYGQPRIVLSVPAEAFVPRPKVDSAVLRIDVYLEPRVPEEQMAAFFGLVRAGFSQKRKQLHNSLASALRIPREDILAALRRAEIDPQRRAQSLAIEEWLSLLRALPHIESGPPAQLPSPSEGW